MTALSQELTGLQTTLTEKEKYFSAQQQNFEQSKLQLSVEFQNPANRILDEKVDHLVNQIKRHWKPCSSLSVSKLKVSKNGSMKFTPNP